MARCRRVTHDKLSSVQICNLPRDNFNFIIDSILIHFRFVSASSVACHPGIHSGLHKVW